MFLNEEQLNKTKANELTAMMNKEAAMLKSYNKRAPTRHSRFGTMVWVTRENGKMSTLSGQDALADPATRELKMDNSKTFRPPRCVCLVVLVSLVFGHRVSLIFCVFV